MNGAKVIHLVGKSKQTTLPGAYERQERLCNGHPCYARLNDRTLMIWRLGNIWHVGQTESCGKDVSYLTGGECAPTPELALEYWQVYDDRKKKWVDAPGLQFLSEGAAKTEVASTSAIVLVLGETPNQAQESRLGDFVRVPNTLVNGYPAFGMLTNQSTSLWFGAQRQPHRPRRARAAQARRLTAQCVRPLDSQPTAAGWSAPPRR